MTSIRKAAFRICLVVVCFIYWSGFIEAFQSRHIITRNLKTVPAKSSPLARPSVKSFSLQSQSLEEDFRLIDNLHENQTNAATTISKGHWFSSWRQNLRMDRKQMAELGTSFMLSYNLISNINGSIFLSISWYISSIRTGLSPLAPGGWKVLLATYAGLYVFNTLVRPLRLAVAIALTTKVSNILDSTQERLGCSKAFSVGFVFMALIAMWLGLAAGGITLASTVAGVPIWKGI